MSLVTDTATREAAEHRAPLAQRSEWMSLAYEAGLCSGVSMEGLLDHLERLVQDG